MGRGRRSADRLVAARAAFAVSAAAFGQTWTCNLSAPASMQPGQSVTLTYAATYNGTTPINSTGSANDDILVGVIVTIATPNASAVYPHIHLSNAHTSDPQLNQCGVFPSPPAQIYSSCTNSFGHPATINPGAVESFTVTLSVDPGTPSAGINFFSDIQQSANGLCNKTPRGLHSRSA